MCMRKIAAEMPLFVKLCKVKHGIIVYKVKKKRGREPNVKQHENK